MKKCLLRSIGSVLLAIFMTSNLYSDSGIFDAFAIVNDQYYDLLNNYPGNPEFAGANFGTFYTTGSLEFSGGEIKTYKNGGDNICGGKIWYSIYPQGGSPGSFSAVTLGFMNEWPNMCCNAGDQQWGTNGNTTNLISGLAPGDYQIAVYVSDWGNAAGQPGCSADPFHTQDNGGAYWVASFSVCEAIVFYADSDGDTYGNPNITQLACSAPSGYVSDNTDCNDGNSNIHPDANEICSNATDDNCNGASGIASVELGLTPDCFTPDYNRIDVSSVSGGLEPYIYSIDGIAFQDTVGFDSLAVGSYTIIVVDDEGCTKSASMTLQPPMSGTSSATNVSCFGGSDGSATAILNSGGGYAPYTYAFYQNQDFYQGGPIAPGGAVTISGLSAGSKRFYLSDNAGCTRPLPGSPVGQPDRLTLAFAKTNVTCNGGSNGSITVSTTGGVPSYLYSWADGPTGALRTGLSAGTYTVIVTDDNGCTKLGEVSISQPGPISTIMTKTNATCAGGSNGTAKVSSPGGATPKTYLWSTGATSTIITGLAAAKYYVTVTDANGCTKLDSVTVGQPAPLNLSFLANNPSCHNDANGNITATATGGTGIKTYAWSNGPTTRTISNLAAGTYTVTTTDSKGCTISSSATLTNPPLLQITSIVSTPGTVSGRFNATVIATGGTGTLRYRRSTATGYTSPALNNVFANLPPGGYNFVVLDSKLCSDTVASPIPVPPLSISPKKTFSLDNQSFELVPNPASGSVRLVFSGELSSEQRLDLRDASGRLLRTVSGENLPGNLLSLDGLPAGLLFVTLRGADFSPMTRRLIVE